MKFPMDNEHPSLSDILTDSSSNESFRDTGDRMEEFTNNNKRKGHIDGGDQNDPDLILDLRYVPTINTYRSDDEESAKLSEVVEEPEDLSLLITTQNSESREDIELTNSLQERMRNLGETMAKLRAELEQEVTLWRKEREEFHLLREKSDVRALEEATAAARAAAEAYAAESPLSDELGDIVNVDPEQTLSELTILEYEKKLAKYQDALALAQAEKRYNMRRQLVANAYRQRLMEVERLCDEELERIKQTANYLRPLKQIASQWCVGDKNCGDVVRQAGQLHVEACKSVSDADDRTDDFLGYRKIDAEVNMVPEIFVATFNCNDFAVRKANAWREMENSRSQVLIGNNLPSPNWYASRSNN